VNTQVCFFFLAVAVAIVIAALRGRTSWFSELGGPGADDDATLSDFATFAPRAEHNDHAGFAAIKRADPYFTLDGFRERVKEMFLAFHAAAEKGDLSATQSFIEPSYYPKLVEQQRATREAGPVHAVTGVRDIRPAIARHEDGMDLVRSSVVGETTDGQAVVEYWELVRRRGATTKPETTIFKCPNCGGPANGPDPSRCAYCGTRLADPALDWVVRRISVG